MKKRRLDDTISKTLGISRKKAKKLVISGRVKVNGLTVKDPKVRVGNEKISVDGTELKPFKEKIYIMLNKPAGFVSSTRDVSPTVFDLIDHPRKRELFLVGRLDKDVEGLLILTNDGQLAHRLTSPKFKVEREYLVTVKDGAEKAKRLEKGIESQGEFLKAKRVEVVNERKFKLVLTEGKYHEVKRMVKSIGLELAHLKRIRYGKLKLDETLKKGEWRELTEVEEKLLKDSANGSVADRRDAER